MARKPEDVIQVTSAKKPERPRVTVVPWSSPELPPPRVFGPLVEEDQEPAPEVLELREQLKVVQEQLEAVSLARRTKAETRERDRMRMKAGKDGKKQETEENTESSGKEARPSKTKASKTSQKRPAGGKSRPASVSDTEEEDKAKHMAHAEKCLLALDLSKLPLEKVGRVVHIVRVREPSLKVFSPDQIDVDLDTLQLSTLWELRHYVDSCMHKKEKSPAAKAEDIPGTSKMKEALPVPLESELEFTSDYSAYDSGSETDSV